MIDLAAIKQRADLCWPGRRGFNLNAALDFFERDVPVLLEEIGRLRAQVAGLLLDLHNSEYDVNVLAEENARLSEDLDDALAGVD